LASVSRPVFCISSPAVPSMPVKREDSASLPLPVRPVPLLPAVVA
jgi:hypothetical protein